MNTLFTLMIAGYVAGALGAVNDLQGILKGLTEIPLHLGLADGVPCPELRGDLEGRALLSPLLWDHINSLEIEVTTKAGMARINDAN